MSTTRTAVRTHWVAIRAMLIWTGLALALTLPLTLAATSEYLAWRDPVYIAAGFAGITALCLSLVQPLLARGWLPGLPPLRGRPVHHIIGVLLGDAECA